MTIPERKTLQYIVQLINPKPEAITENTYNTQTIPLAFDLSSEQSLKLWEVFVGCTGATITFFDFCTYKIVQLCQFMPEKFNDPTHFDYNILADSSTYIFAGEDSTQIVGKDSFEADLSMLRQKYPESAIAGIYDPLKRHAESKYGEHIPADIQLVLSNLNAQMFGVATTKFDAVLESCPFLVYYKKELDASIERVNQQKNQIKIQEQEEDDLDEDDDFDEDTDCDDNDETIEPVFIDGFLCDLKPVVKDIPVHDAVRRTGVKIYFGRYENTVPETEAKNYRKLSMKVIKLNYTTPDGGFYWVRCPENAIMQEQLIDIIENGI
jgi:hypothetical protein